MIIGEKIKYHRDLNAFSQEHLAEIMETSKQTISNWENGKTYPNIQNLVSLSRIFNIAVEELIKEDIQSINEKMETTSTKLKRGKDRDIIKSLNLLRFTFILTGSITLYPVYHYFGFGWSLIPILLLFSTLILTLLIEYYRKKYTLKSYEDIVAYFEQNYHNE